MRKQFILLACLFAIGLTTVAQQAQTSPVIGICYMESLEGGDVQCSGSCGGAAVEPWTCNKGESCDLNCVTGKGGCHATDLND